MLNKQPTKQTNKQTTMKALFLECDKDGSNEISFDEFINSLRGPMTSRRREVISRIFEGIDR
jgi:Ca2+-binding EF-hand superfamily protein